MTQDTSYKGLFFCLFILKVKVLVLKRNLGAAGDEPGPERKHKALSCQDLQE